MQTLRTWLILGLRWCLAQLEPPTVPAPIEVPTRDPILARAIVLTAEQQARWPERSGEAKRHQVLSVLMKEFAEASHRQISRAIEEAID